MTATQDTLVDGIVEERTKIFAQLYEQMFPKIAKFVANRGGTFDEAKDIFQDALVIFYEKSSHGNKFEYPEHYLAGIAKHLWIRKFKDNRKTAALDEFGKDITIAEDYFEPAENRLVSLLELTGRKCLSLLQAFYYDNLSIAQIKTVFGFSTAHSASAQKFKCIEKMRNIIREKSMGYEDFA